MQFKHVRRQLLQSSNLMRHASSSINCSVIRDHSQWHKGTSSCLETKEVRPTTLPLIETRVETEELVKIMLPPCNSVTTNTSQGNSKPIKTYSVLVVEKMMTSGIRHQRELVIRVATQEIILETVVFNFNSKF